MAARLPPIPGWPAAAGRATHIAAEFDVDALAAVLALRTDVGSASKLSDLRRQLGAFLEQTSSDVLDRLSPAEPWYLKDWVHARRLPRFNDKTQTQLAGELVLFTDVSGAQTETTAVFVQSILTFGGAVCRAVPPHHARRAGCDGRAGMDALPAVRATCCWRGVTGAGRCTVWGGRAVATRRCGCSSASQPASSAAPRTCFPSTPATCC